MTIPDSVNAVALAIRTLVAATDAFATAVDAGFAAVEPLPEGLAWNRVPGESPFRVKPEAVQRLQATRVAMSDARRKLAESFTALEAAAEVADREAACP